MKGNSPSRVIRQLRCTAGGVLVTGATMGSVTSHQLSCFEKWNIHGRHFIIGIYFAKSLLPVHELNSQVSPHLFGQPSVVCENLLKAALCLAVGMCPEAALAATIPSSNSRQLAVLRAVLVAARGSRLQRMVRT